MSKKSRIEFSRPVVEKLRARVAHRCSNPECRTPTSAPGTGDMDVNSTGVAAHIHAASPGGPRFLSTMTQVERSSIKNAIWLCANCSIQIDRDAAFYSEALLRDWKNKAETQARHEQGRKPPQAHDGTDLLVAALTGQSSRLAPGALHNVHKATTTVLEALDPRFRVQTEYENGRARVTLHAKERVDFSMQVRGETVKHWQAGLANAINHGRAAKLPLLGANVKGLPIIEQALAEMDMPTATMEIIPTGQKAIAKIVVGALPGTMFQADDVHGVIYPGLQTFRFEGSIYDGLIDIELCIDVEGSSGSTASIALNLDRWHGKDVRHLQYLDKIAGFFAAATREAACRIELDVSGKCDVRMHVSTAAWGQYYTDINSFLMYTKAAQSLSNYTGSLIEFNRDVIVSRDAHNWLHRVVSIFAGRAVYTADQLESRPSLTLIAEDEGNNICRVGDRDDTLALRCVYPPQSIEVFGTSVLLPAACIDISDVKTQVKTDLLQVKAGDAVEIDLIPGPEFRVIYRFVDDLTEISPMSEGPVTSATTISQPDATGADIHLL